MKSKILIPILFFLAYGAKSQAAYVFAGALSYKFISATENTSTYSVTLELDIPCDPPGPIQARNTNMAGAIPEIELMKGNTRIGRYNLSYIRELSGQDISPLCPEYKNLSFCVNLNEGAYIGVSKYVYSGEIVLNGTDENWTFVFNGVLNNVPYERAMVYTEIYNADVIIIPSGPPPDTDIIHLEATLNNTTGPNNSVSYTSPPIVISNVNSKYYYGIGPADPDHDALKFKLVPVRIMKGSYLNPVIQDAKYYNPPFNSTHPLPTTPDNFKLNASNGQMEFTPNETGLYLIAVQTDEYRNGIVVGTTVRQMTFIFDDVTNNAASTADVINVKNADYTFDADGNLFLSACEGISDTVSFDINVTDPDFNNVTVGSDNLPTAANVSVEADNTQNPVVHFRWFPTEAEAFTYSFFLTYTDDGCPYQTQRNITYTFTLIPHSVKFQDSSSGSCVSVADGKAWVMPIGTTSIDYTYKWVDISTGNVLRDVSSKTGDTLTNVPPGIYKVYVRNSEGCGKNFFIKVDTTLLPKLDLPNDTTLCKGMYLEIGTEPEPATAYQWNTGQTTCCFRATEGANYRLDATNHCGTSMASVNLDVVKCSYCFFVPNAFSPNGDGNNDVFKITPTCLFSKYKLFIYNRWGQRVFISYNIQDSWDGTFKGQDVQMGTYFYVLDAVLDDISKELVHLTGDINVIK